MGMSNAQARHLAGKLGFGGVHWDWEAPRSREGYFRVLGGVDYSTMRAIAFSPLSDLIWMETATPNVPECEEFSKGVHAARPHQMLAYNLSPSFNWDAAGMSIDSFIVENHVAPRTVLIFASRRKKITVACHERNCNGS